MSISSIGSSAAARAAPGLRAFAQVFRCEYLPAEAPGLCISFFLCARRLDDALALPVIEGLLAVLMVIFAGLGINAVVDRDIDRKYATFKNQIPDAIEALGLQRTWALIGMQLAAAFALGVHISLQRGSWVAIALVASHIFFGVGYSLPPLQFKLRGTLWHALSLSLATTVLPFVLTVYTYLGTTPLPLLVFLLGFALVQYAWEFGNQAIDYLEDRQEGLATPPVRLGLSHSLRLALGLAGAGVLAVAAGIWWLLVQRGVDLTGHSPLLTRPVVWGAVLAVILAGYAIPLAGLWRMYSLSRQGSPEACVPRMRPFCRYARWQASSILGVAAGAGVFYLAATFSPQLP